MFKRKGGGVKGFLNNVQKNCTFLTGWLPLIKQLLHVFPNDMWAKPLASTLSDCQPLESSGCELSHGGTLDGVEYLKFLSNSRFSFPCFPCF